MDSWLKGLIATACIVIITGGAYFAWDVYAEYKDEAAYVKNAPFRHCDRVFADVKRVNKFVKMINFTPENIVDENEKCRKLLGISSDS